MSSSAYYNLGQSKGFLPVPFSRHIPIFAAAVGITWLCSALNARNFSPVETMSPEYKTRENIIQRTEAPAVFINPIYNGLPGNILGPDDIEARH